MSEDIIVVGIVFGSIVAIVICTLLYKLIKSSISSSTYDDEAFDRMAQAFIKYKKDTEQRLQNLEAIVADDRENKSSKNKFKQSDKKIDIEEPSPENKERNKKGKLKNILKD